MGRAANKNTYTKMCPVCKKTFKTPYKQKVNCSVNCTAVKNEERFIEKSSTPRGNIMKEIGDRIFEINKGAKWPEPEEVFEVL